MNTTQEAYNILALVGEAILTKDGCLSLLYEMRMPECYSLSEEEIENLQESFFNAFSHIKKGYIHRQDIYQRSEFYYPIGVSESFLSNSDKKTFEGRLKMEHKTILVFTLSGISGLEKAYISNPLSYKEALTKASKEQVSVFLESVESVVTILRGKVDIFPLSRESMYEYIFSLSNGLYQDGGIRDIVFESTLNVGTKKGQILALCQEEYMPDRVTCPVADTTIRAKGLFMTELEELGVHFPYTHVVNQIWRFEGRSFYELLKGRVKTFGRHRDFDPDIKKEYEELEEYQSKMRNDTLCRYHYNILLLEENEEFLLQAVNRVKEVLRNADFNFYIPSYESLHLLFLGSIPGREFLLGTEMYSILLDLKTSLSLNSVYSLQKGDEKGVWFNDRIYQTPLQIDLWDEEKKRIPARNAIVIASTGGGKSVATLNIIQQYLEQGVKVIVVEFGKSFYQLTQLYPEQSIHIDYDGKMPLGINPFYVPNGTPDKEKIKTLVNLVLIFWRRPAITEDTAQVVSLTRLIEGYYCSVSEGHSFPSFYRFVKDLGESLFDVFQIQKEYFDLESFLHICSEFCENGYYENVCQDSTLGSTIAEKDFIVFELTQIKKDPFLVSVIMSILFDTIENKILSDRSIKGMLVFDEYAEAQAIRDQHSGIDIHSTVAFCYQKLRKENGAIMTIIQSPAQLPENEYTKGIISNTQLLFVLPTNNVVYDQTIERFHIQENSQIALLKSGRNDFTSSRPYSEIYIGFIPDFSTVVRLELSPERLLAFQTDGDVWNELQTMVQSGKTLEESIKYKLYN